MTKDKRKQIIMESAMQLFSEKGFFSTSVQEIAEKSGVAKGSIYKFFPSKEDLLISIFEYYQNEMLFKVRQIRNNPTLTPKEVLIQQIQYQMDDYLKNRKFIKLQFRELSNHEDDKIKPFMLASRKKMMNWHKEQLLFAFGNEVTPYVWDIVIMFQGIIKEYFSVLIFEEQQIDTKLIAYFIVERMEGLIKELLETKPVSILKHDMINRFMQNTAEEKTDVSAILAEMKQIIETQPFDELIILYHELEKELHKKNPEKIIIAAYLDYLGKEEHLSELAKNLKMRLQINKENKGME